VDWTQKTVAGRNPALYHREGTTAGKPGRGCPQGGVLSILLWCLVVNDLFEDLKRESLHVYCYADDIAIVAGGRFLTTLRDLIEHAVKMTYRWCKTKGLVVNPQTTNVMIFNRKYKPEVIEPLRLEGEKIVFTNSSEIHSSLIRP
jgi:hypothetical protein